MMHYPTSKKRITFIEAAYQAFDNLRDVLGTYHVAKHTEIIGDSPVLCGWNKQYDEEANRTYNRLYVEGTCVLVEIIDHNTANRMIRTTNGDKWYGNSLAQGFRQAEESSQTRFQASWAA